MYYLSYSSPTFYDSSYLYHYGVEGMKWGIRKDSYEDGKPIRSEGRLLIGYDGDESYNASENIRNADYYARKWERDYGSLPINRLRFDYGGHDTVNRGSKYCDEYDWHRTSLDSIYESYREYKDSEDWD